MKKYLINYYENTRQYYGNYHDHKEISAWSGLVIHILFCTFIVLANPTGQLKIIMTIGFTISVIIVTILLFMYIRNQLNLKDKAGALAAASNFILTELIAKDDNSTDFREYLSVEESSDIKYQSTHVLPKKLLNKVKIYDSRGRGAQDFTRTMIYGLLVISAISVIFYRWIAIL
ncbi:MAG: hypothetical protein C4B59_14610 [Candidatus Methanogaster sp.]|uniref:Uncharacterized protein n=1 Tax=Candidatus Methanogaster sp. TaxID=3386292 RepID=A0AC61KZA1_9EURY|nr:MAG: hypothetical protein C4B59_14610 [ANME-2 cluster archaeon]